MVCVKGTEKYTFSTKEFCALNFSVSMFLNHILMSARHAAPKTFDQRLKLMSA